MKTAAKTDIKQNLTTLYKITYNAGEFISDMLNAFIYNRSNLLEEYRSTAGIYVKDIRHISGVIKDAADNDEAVKPYVTVPENLLKIYENMEKLCTVIDKKINQNVLFPDMCVDESTYLLQRLIEILRPTADVILARNMFLKKYIQESQKSIERNATAYATMHEEILITGMRLPTASSIHISMLEAIKAIAWNAKEIALALAK